MDMRHPQSGELYAIGNTRSDWWCYLTGCCSAPAACGSYARRASWCARPVTRAGDALGRALGRAL
eukprot:1998747-Prymnesium_polylepis.1